LPRLGIHWNHPCSLAFVRVSTIVGMRPDARAYCPFERPLGLGESQSAGSSANEACRRGTNEGEAECLRGMGWAAGAISLWEDSVKEATRRRPKTPRHRELNHRRRMGMMQPLKEQKHQVEGGLSWGSGGEQNPVGCVSRPGGPTLKAVGCARTLARLIAGRLNPTNSLGPCVCSQTSAGELRPLTQFIAATDVRQRSRGLPCDR
jgi:hypothetical protein